MSSLEIGRLVFIFILLLVIARLGLDMRGEDR